MRTTSRTLVAALVAVAIALAACSGSGGTGSTATSIDPTPTATATAGSSVVPSEAAVDNAPDHDEPADHEWSESDVVAITLLGGTATSTGDAVSVDGGIVTIGAAGTYRLSGRLDDGRLVVDTDDEGIVRLVLDGVTIHDSTNAAISVEDADEVVIVLAEGSESRLSDGATYVYEDPATYEPNAALFSTADLTITGGGALTIVGNANDAIASKDGLVIAGGTIVVEAVDDGIRGKDYLVIDAGSVTVEAGGDGLKSDNDEDATLGYIAINGGVVAVDAGGDGIQAATDVLVHAGEVTVTAGGGAGAALATDASAKGLKGSVNVTIGGGRVAVDAADDAIHSNGAIVVTAGTIDLATGDDGLHADNAVTVSGGTIAIERSYEGLESAAITIAGGDIAITADDDGLNAAGGIDGSGFMGPGGGPGGDQFGSVGDYSITIGGGTIVIDADGDGIDANGSVTMTGGTVIVNGPLSSGNSALDHGSFAISGGLLVASGSAGMAQAPDAVSSQLSLHVQFSSPQAAGTVVHLQTTGGAGLLTFIPTKQFQSVVVSTPDVAADQTYEVYVGGTTTGESLAGLITGGTYSPGELAGTTTTAEAQRQNRWQPGGPGQP
jgi:hypothetical protein